jgi:hypothetical protein
VEFTIPHYGPARKPGISQPLGNAKGLDPWLQHLTRALSNLLPTLWKKWKVCTQEVYRASLWILTWWNSFVKLTVLTFPPAWFKTHSIFSWCLFRSGKSKISTDCSLTGVFTCSLASLPPGISVICCLCAIIFILFCSHRRKRKHQQVKTQSPLKMASSPTKITLINPHFIFYIFQIFNI